MYAEPKINNPQAENAYYNYAYYIIMTKPEM